MLAPVLWPEVLPKALLSVQIAAPGPPPNAKPPGPQARPTNVPVVRKQLTAGILIAPTTIPPHPQIIEDPAPDLSGAPGVPGVAGGIPGIPNGDSALLTSLVAAGTPTPIAKPPAPTPEAPKPEVVTAPKRVHRGINFAEPIFRPEPAYPPLARTARISGTVELSGVIGIDGRMHELRVVRGHPLLVKAAVDAVSQWVYKPTRLNGEPVEVDAPITVVFKLSQ